jgi:hypothetical protein
VGIWLSSLELIIEVSRVEILLGIKEDAALKRGRSFEASETHTLLLLVLQQSAAAAEEEEEQVDLQQLTG